MRRILVFAAAAAVLVSIALADAKSGDDHGSESAEPSVLVETTALQRGSLPNIVTTYGSVQPSAAAQQTIVAPLSAVVGEVYVHQGQQVGANARLVRLVPSPKSASAYAQAKVAVDVARQLVERTQRLLALHLATGQQLADARKSASDARSNLAALQAEGAAGPAVLKAPFGAVVTKVVTKAGAIVSEGSNLLDLARPNGLLLQVGVVPEQATEIEPGQKVEITPLGNGDPASGRVLLCGSIVDATNGLVSVEIGVPPGKFLMGQMASAAITTGETKGFIVPHQAILIDDQGRTYVMQAINMTANKVFVRVLDSNGDKDVIEGKLDATAPVVLAGNHQLENGMKVRLAGAHPRVD